MNTQLSEAQKSLEIAEHWANPTSSTLNAVAQVHATIALTHAVMALTEVLLTKPAPISDEDMKQILARLRRI